jgi:hypothetical protein
MPLEIEPRSRPKHLMVADAHARSTADPIHPQGVRWRRVKAGRRPPAGHGLDALTTAAKLRSVGSSKGRSPAGTAPADGQARAGAGRPETEEVSGQAGEAPARRTKGAPAERRASSGDTPGRGAAAAPSVYAVAQTTGLRLWVTRTPWTTRLPTRHARGQPASGFAC